MNITQNEIARQLGISGPTFSAQVARGCPNDSVENARAWRADNLNPAKMKGAKLDQYRETPDTDGETFEAARTRKTIAEADKAQIEAAVLRDEYLRRDEFERYLYNAGRMLRDTLTNCARRIGAEVSSLDTADACEEVIYREHRAALASFSKSLLDTLKIEIENNPLNKPIEVDPVVRQ